MFTALASRFRRKTIPSGGWQLNGVGPAIHPIGEDGEIYIAFGTWSRDLFCKTLIACMEHTGEIMDYTPHPNEVTYPKVAIIDEYDGFEFGINWADDSDGKRNVDVTMWKAC